MGNVRHFRRIRKNDIPFLKTFAFFTEFTEINIFRQNNDKQRRIAANSGEQRRRIAANSGEQQPNNSQSKNEIRLWGHSNNELDFWGSPNQAPHNGNLTTHHKKTLVISVFEVFEKTRCLSTRAHSYVLYVGIPT